MPTGVYKRIEGKNYGCMTKGKSFMQGKKHSYETIQKMKESAKNRKTKIYKQIGLYTKHSPQTLLKISKSVSLKLKGIPKTLEHRKALGLSHKGTIVSQQTRQKMRISHIGLKHSIESRKKMSGKNSIHWKGGSNSINNQIRNSLEYKLWRESVFKRDNYQCIWGGKEHGNNLCADHIKPFSLFPELRLAIDNGRTLCKECHKKTDTYLWRINKK